VDEEGVFEQKKGEAQPVFAYADIASLTETEGRTEYKIAAPAANYFYIKDHLGSTRMTVDENGDQSENVNYLSYGTEMDLGVSASFTREKYTGKEFDKEGAGDDGTGGIGLYYFGKRYYDAEIGRWISVDPERQFFDLYAYTGNGFNPISSFDMKGLWQLSIGAGFGIAIKLTGGINNGQLNLGGGIGIGWGIKGNFTLANSDPNGPLASEKGNNTSSKVAFGIETTGDAGISGPDGATSVSGALSIKAKGDISNTSAEVSGELGGSLHSSQVVEENTSTLNVNNLNGELSYKLKATPKQSLDIGGAFFGFIGFVGGYTFDAGDDANKEPNLNKNQSESKTETSSEPKKNLKKKTTNENTNKKNSNTKSGVRNKG
jgi:RHS repeat-associated protein